MVPEGKPTKRAERRVHQWRDKAKRGNKRAEGHKEYFAEQAERKLTQDPVVSQSLFVLMVDEVTERSAYPDERTNRGQCNIAEAIRRGIVAYVDGN